MTSFSLLNTQDRLPPHPHPTPLSISLASNTLSPPHPHSYPSPAALPPRASDFHPPPTSPPSPSISNNTPSFHPDPPPPSPNIDRKASIQDHCTFLPHLFSITLSPLTLSPSLPLILALAVLGAAKAKGNYPLATSSDRATLRPLGGN